MTLMAELSYAYVLYKAERPGEALSYILDVLRGLERDFDPDYPVMLNARNSLTVILAALGRYPEAIAQAEEVAERRARVLGPTHPWTLSIKELLDEYRRSQTEA
jgi:hypothetical protein